MESCRYNGSECETKQLGVCACVRVPVPVCDVLRQRLFLCSFYSYQCVKYFIKEGQPYGNGNKCLLVHIKVYFIYFFVSFWIDTYNTYI